MKQIKLQTPVKMGHNSHQLEHGIGICGIGSCFAQDILTRMYNVGFTGEQNPNGIVYNSHSIAQSLLRAANSELYTNDDFFKHNDRWCSWEHHGSYSDVDINKAVAGANTALKQFHAAVIESGVFVMTPSSSVIYQRVENKKIVANCHKVPNHLFQRRLLSQGENELALHSSIASIHSINPLCKIIFTLSPVRHYPGDLVLNARSKANLLAAIHNCVDQYDFVEYFPAYEIVLDELRDYRFFNEDMLHPNELARNIIFQRFIDTYFSAHAHSEIEAAEKIYRASLHRTN